MTFDNEPSFNDIILLLDPVTGLPGNALSRVMRVVSSDSDEELWEVVDKYNRTRIVTAGAEDGQWLEVELDP